VVAAADDVLLAAMASGDQSAATTFVRRHQQRVYGLAMSILSDAGAAEDVAQEAFTRAWRHAGVFDAQRASATTWLLAITRNLAIDAARLRRSSPTDPTTLTALLGAGAGPGPAEQAMARTEQRGLVEALSRLPEDQRRAVVLASIGGRTGVEISELEGIPLGTAKTRIRTALRRLREDLSARETPIDLTEPTQTRPCDSEADQ
jgi:RNA polymerase sigma-70 factor (ECF subfamily)